MRTSFNFKHLYYFWVVAKEGGMSRAADKLDMAVQTVSAQVRVGAEARTTKAMLEYLERLRTSARLSPAVLQTHQVMTEDPHRPIRFTFTASWISAKSAPN